MSPSRLLCFATSHHGLCWKYVLAALLGLGVSMDLFAQLPAESELLKVSAPQPNAIKKLALEEFQTVVVHYKNKTKTTATLLAMPYTNGLPTPGYGYKPLSVEPRSSGTVEVSFKCYSPAVVDEIRVKMRDLVTKEELAVVGVPVQMTWGDATPAPPPAPVTNPAPAPVPKPTAGQPETLKIKALQPASPGKLALGEKMTLNIQYINSGESPVRILALPYKNGVKAPDIVFTGSKQLNGWDELLPKGSGTVARWFYGKVPQEVDEIEVSMWDLAAKKLVSTLKVPVKLTWSGSATANKAVLNQAAGQPGMLRFELQGYEISQDAAATLFISQPGELDPKALLTATAALAGARKATIVKLPFIEAASGARAVAAPVGGYSLEAELTRGGGGYVNAIYALRRASDQSGMTNGVLGRMGGITFMGSLPGSSADTVVLMFARFSEL